MDGFFSASQMTVKRQPPMLLPYCAACGLYRECHSPKMPVYGRGQRQILLLGEAPGTTEDETGRPFCGPAGKLLDDALLRLGVNLHLDCWVTNSLICFPREKKFGGKHHRTPTDKEISYCRPNLIKSIKELKPQVIIPLGKTAVQSLIGWLWAEGVGTLGRWAGWQIPHVDLNCWICPTWHPSAILRQGNEKEEPVQELLWRRHLEGAVTHDERPYSQLSDYRSRIKTTVLIEDALTEIYQFLRGGRPLAVDFESTTRKPDSGHARIVSCAISDGHRSVAYPWHGAAIGATQELLRSPLGKIASNCKHEERWCRKVFGHGVRNWVWDTMLTAHILDNRPRISGLKFQAFVQLGVPLWNQGVEPYLKSGGSNTPNRIGEVPLDKILLYNAYDSLYEFHVAKKQAEQLGMELC